MKMAKQEKIVWSFLTIILVILFLLSSTDLIIKEKKSEIYPVSVIIGDTTDDYYTNFRMGADKAAAEYNVDVSFITLYDKDAAQQMGLLNREIDDGAGAVVLSPLKQRECGNILKKMALDSPLIITGDMYPDSRVSSGVSQDYRIAGKILGEAIVRENSLEKPVFLLSEGLEYGYNQEIYDSVVSVLADSGFQVRLWENPVSGSTDVFLKAVGEAARSGNGGVIIAALDIKSLNTAVDTLAGDPAYGKSVAGLYGVGSTTKLLNEMDRGNIRGLVVSNQYDAGYLAIVKAVEAIEKRGGREQIVLDSYYIEKDDLQKSRFEKILYPIE